MQTIDALICTTGFIFLSAGVWPTAHSARVRTGEKSNMYELNGFHHIWIGTV